MTYSLRGVVGIHATIEPGAFLVPYFVASWSNYTFAQELGADYRVKSFKPIEISRFALRSVVHQAIDIDIGDIGVVAFVDPDAAFVVDYAQDAKAALKAADFGSKLSAFRRIDICYFLQDFAGLDEAIDVAASCFANPDVRRTWKKVERTAAKQARAVASKKVDVDAIRKSFEGAGAYDNWIGAWRSLGPSDWILADGLRLAFEGTGSTGTRIRIASHVIVGLKAASVSLEARSKLKSGILAWLAGDGLVHETAMWSKVWLAASRHEDLLDSHSLQLGIRYLETTPFDHLPRNNWAKVWRVLWARRGDKSEWLLALVADALANFGHTSHARRLIAMLSEMIDSPPIAAIVYDWVLSNDPNNSEWVVAYLSLLKIEEYQTYHFLDIGLSWLQNDTGKLKKWADVYEQVSRYRGQDVMSPIAADWLLRANPQMRVWPKIAAEVLRFSDDFRLKELVANWIKAHPTSEESWELQLLLDNTPS